MEERAAPTALQIHYLRFAMSKISVRFLIDKEHNRVLFAEAGSDFVDVLFSFLTLPLGSIVRLLGKQSGFGSLDSLYVGVEQLDEKCLQVEACKEMLLNPRSAASILCEDLKIKNIHIANPRTFFICNESDCLSQSTCYYTYTNKNRCGRCGKLLIKRWQLSKKTSDKGGIFVEDTIHFMITDDLRVIPTLMRGYSLIEILKIKDARNLEEKLIDFGTKEVLSLLRRSLVSKIPLTEVCLGEVSVQASGNCSLMLKEEKKENEAADSEITLKLILDKKKNNVLCAEVGEDFINQLLSFLTFPLGSVLKLLSDNVSVLGGCIGNLYSSVENMRLECFKSEDCRNILLTPKLATFYGIEKQMLNLEEISSEKLVVLGGCLKCYADNGLKPLLSAKCKHGVQESEIIEKDPKSVKVMTCSGGAFVVDSRRFMVSDNFHISLLSFISIIKTYKINIPIDDLVQKDVCLDKAKVLSLLSTMLISKTVLTDVFYPKPSGAEEDVS